MVPSRDVDLHRAAAEDAAQDVVDRLVLFEKGDRSASPGRFQVEGDSLSA
jgi:hypothetical protein